MTGPALCEHLVGEIAPILRYEGRVQAFGGRLRDDTAQIIAKAGIANRDLRSCDLLAQPGLHERAGGDDRAHQFKIGRAHVCTPVTTAHLVCRLLLANTTTLSQLPCAFRISHYHTTGTNAEHV